MLVLASIGLYLVARHHAQTFAQGIIITASSPISHPRRWVISPGGATDFASRAQRPSRDRHSRAGDLHVTKVIGFVSLSTTPWPRPDPGGRARWRRLPIGKARSVSR